VRLSSALHLVAEADAAVDGGDPERPGMGERADVVDDLPGELPGRGEDEGRLAGAVRFEPVDDRHAEGERLAGAGRGLDEDVVAIENVGDRQPLNRERFGEAALGKCAHDWARHAEFGE
jgi:hypothetical protein